jgi:predicted nucleic acid-binding protein
MRILLDANILFSAAKSKGAIRELLDTLQDWKHELVGDAYVEEEARRNLLVRYPESISYYDALLKRIALSPLGSQTQTISALSALPEKDRPVLAGAIGARCSILMTGDSRHFGHLYGKTIQGVCILSPRDTLEQVRLK